jgi:hypothetical protein
MGFVPDEEGRELPGLDAAHGEAIDGIRSLISDEARKGLIDLTGKIEIADATGNILAQVGYAEAIELRLPERPSD